MKQYTDTSTHQQQRHKLVRALQDKGIEDKRVLKAMETVPRHLFLPADKQDLAYADRAIPIEAGQTISQPYTVANQTQLLRVKPGDKVLEIGTGSVYQASVLAVMGAEVYTIERQKKLFEKGRGFSYLGQFSNIRFFYGDGFEGLPEHAPFDKILITAAAPFIPPRLVEQLKPGGIMVLPIGAGVVQTMMRIIRKENGGLYKEYFNDFSFVPMLHGKKE